jgi:hypothetical protein
MRYIAGLMMLAAVVAGFASSTPPAMPAGQTPVDVTGTWSGPWEGHGVQKIKRHDSADARFAQQGTTGHGRLWLEAILASESIPLTARLAGAKGAPLSSKCTAVAS